MQEKMVFLSRWRHAFALVLACSMATPWAQTPDAVTAYENDFESPVRSAMPVCEGGWLGGAAGLFAQEYGTVEHPVLQVGSVDRICIGNDSADANAFYDSTDRGGSFAGGLMSSRVRGGVEAFGLTLDPQGHVHLNVSLDWSLANVRAEPDFRPSEPRDAVARFYRVPAESAPILRAGGAGADAAFVVIDGSTAEAFFEDRFTVQPWPAEEAEGREYELNWQRQDVAVDLSEKGVEPGDKVAVVFHLAGDEAYAAFDNVLVTASTPPTVLERARSFVASKPWESPWSLVLAGLALVGLAANRVLRLR